MTSAVNCCLSSPKSWYLRDQYLELDWCTGFATKDVDILELNCQTDVLLRGRLPPVNYSKRRKLSFTCYGFLCSCFSVVWNTGSNASVRTPPAFLCNRNCLSAPPCVYIPRSLCCFCVLFCFFLSVGWLLLHASSSDQPSHLQLYNSPISYCLSTPSMLTIPEMSALGHTRFWAVSLLLLTAFSVWWDVYWCLLIPLIFLK